jgi:hypothetical protein
MSAKFLHLNFLLCLKWLIHTILQVMLRTEFVHLCTCGETWNGSLISFMLCFQRFSWSHFLTWQVNIFILHESASVYQRMLCLSHSRIRKPPEQSLIKHAYAGQTHGTLLELEQGTHCVGRWRGMFSRYGNLRIKHGEFRRYRTGSNRRTLHHVVYAEWGTRTRAWWEWAFSYAVRRSFWDVGICGKV